MILESIAHWALRLYFLRVPILCWLVVAALGPVGFRLAPDFFSGLLYVESPAGLAITSAAACLFSAACLAALNLIRYGSELRFTFPIGKGGGLKLFAAAHLAPASLCGMMIAGSVAGGSDLPAWKLVLAVLAGYVLAGALVILSRMIQWLFADPGKAAPLSLVLPETSFTPFDDLLRESNPAPVRWIRSAAGSAGRWMLPLTGRVTREGYVEPQIKAGHIYAATLLGVTLAIDVLAGAARQADISPEGFVSPVVQRSLEGLSSRITFGALPSEAIPPLAWLMFLLTLAVWLLSGLTYFLDRYRFPVLAGAALLAGITTGSPVSDHFYRTEPAGNWERPAAAEVVRQRQSADGKLILVSAPGGGIQAAAWATWVLKELDQRVRQNRAELMPRIAAMSGVSGGSVGLFHLAAAGFDPDRAYQSSIRPAIADVAWGWMVPDRWNAFFPWVRKEVVDRGWALEFALERNAGVGHAGSLFLDEPGLKPGAQVPALLLNATVMETGQPLVFSTSRFLEPPAGERPVCGPLRGSTGLVDFADLYHRRIRLATAARLSASFPYVSPGARTFPDAPLCPDFHLLDGGYYDNYGIIMLMEWLRSAWEGLADSQRPKKVLLVRVYGFPEKAPAPSVQGWGGQLLVPLAGVLSARENSQSIVTRSIADLVGRSLPGTAIETVDFNYPARQGCEAPPLNWILTRKQIDCIQQTPWQGPLADNGRRVVEFLQTAAPRAAN